MSITAWETDFPRGYGHTSIAFIKRCEGFKRERMQERRSRYTGAVLLPVTSGVGNALPEAFAQNIGFPMWRGVYMRSQGRKHMSAYQRLSVRPAFFGAVLPGRRYIIVDDIVTTGGTVAALREYVLCNGGYVVAVAALAFAYGSHALAPRHTHKARLLEKFGAALEDILRGLGIALENLTNSQMVYLLRFSSERTLRERLLPRQPNEKTDG